MTGKPITVDGCDTLPKLFLKKSAERGDRIAMREKDFGIWQSYSWNDYRARALDIAYGLLSLGLARGDVVSIHGQQGEVFVGARELVGVHGDASENPAA